MVKIAHFTRTLNTIKEFLNIVILKIVVSCWILIDNHSVKRVSVSFFFFDKLMNNGITNTLPLFTSSAQWVFQRSVKKLRKI